MVKDNEIRYMNVKKVVVTSYNFDYAICNRSPNMNNDITSTKL